MSEVKIGIVCWFNNKKGYGFITQENADDLFVHFSDINFEGYKSLEKGQKVSYEIGLNNEGRNKAVSVNVIK